MKKHIGILTADGDSPGLNAAIRAFGKAALGQYGFQVTGFLDGFHGLLTGHAMVMERHHFSGILTVGGTILGTSREKIIDLDPLVQNIKKHQLDALVCFGGHETQNLALRLKQAGVNIITLPKSITNHIHGTDQCIGYDTALTIAAQSIDRLHSTAHSHHRIMLVEIMGEDSGWLTLGAGIAGGSDVILIPEIPYQVQSVASAILERSQKGKRFSLVAVSQGAISDEDNRFFQKARKVNRDIRSGEEQIEVGTQLREIENEFTGKTIDLAERLREATNLETQITILGFLQRGGEPTAADRLLATMLGTVSARLVSEEIYGVMTAKHAGKIEPVLLEEVAQKNRPVPLNHSWIESARAVGTNFGD
ncbi:MAG: ATP-dependent 6-phosphofructokinase [Anaerolineaceae bacterium]|nr:ATP-dependent 6-phosphofructokinase [Anaerolineaceae bacterium]